MTLAVSGSKKDMLDEMMLEEDEAYYGPNRNRRRLVWYLSSPPETTPLTLLTPPKPSFETIRYPEEDPDFLNGYRTPTPRRIQRKSSLIQYSSSRSQDFDSLVRQAENQEKEAEENNDPEPLTWPTPSQISPQTADTNQTQSPQQMINLEGMDRWNIAEQLLEGLDMLEEDEFFDTPYRSLRNEGIPDIDGSDKLMLVTKRTPEQA